MKKFLLSATFVFTIYVVNAQITDTAAVTKTVEIKNTSIKTKKDWSKLDLSNRSNDHFMMQYGADTWTTTNDSVSPKGFSRFFNAYIMLDKPFRGNPRYSVGLGVGIGSSNMFFKNTYVDLKSTANKLPFQRVDTTNHFKKFKVTTIFLEAPIELRFCSNPDDNNRSFKWALGAKVGTLLTAYNKGKTLLDKNGNTINDYIEKQSSKKFFNGTKLAATARVGYGIFSLYGSYQITSVLKDGVGIDVKPYSIGIAISGL